MKCAVIYTSMTGNTEIIAKGVRDGIFSEAGHCDLIKMRDADPYGLGGYGLIGIGCPVMGYGPSRDTLQFIEKMRYVGGKHFFAFATHGTHGEYYPSKVAKVLDKAGVVIIGIRRWYANSYIPGHMNPYPTAGHPDKIDLQEAADFGKQVASLSRRIHDGQTDLIPPLPEDTEEACEEMLRELMRKEDERSEGRFGSNTPHVQAPEYEPEKCKYPACSLCMDNCPVHGIDLTVSPARIADPCISCMMCAKICPNGAYHTDFIYDTPGEKTAKLVPEFYLEQLEIDEASGMFRRNVPVEEIGWDTPYYKTYTNTPWFILGKGPNGPKSKYWGEGMAEYEQQQQEQG